MSFSSSFDPSTLEVATNLPKSKNIMYGQAGGVTAVINASAAAVIETAKQFPQYFGDCFAAINGIQGVLEENFVNASQMSDEEIAHMHSIPGAVFGACRFDLDPLEHNPTQYARILDIFKAYDIGYFFYNGGNGSMVTALKVAEYCQSNGHDVRCIGVAKTIDNDLALSYCSPGFGSAAKYLATSFIEAGMDVLAMHKTSTKFFVMEAMGRDVGWLSLAGSLIKEVIPNAPVIILPAEKAFNKEKFLAKVDEKIAQQGYCLCMASEGLRDESGNYLAIAGVEHTDEGDYTQLGGAGRVIADIASAHLDCKIHCAVPDYLQRSASHCVSATDWQMAYDAGKAAVIAALQGEHGTLPVVSATSESPLEWTMQSVDLEKVANLEYRVPDDFLTEDAMDVSDKGHQYLLSVIQGERPLSFQNGLPSISPIALTLCDKRLKSFDASKNSHY